MSDTRFIDTYIDCAMIDKEYCMTQYDCPVCEYAELLDDALKIIKVLDIEQVKALLKFLKQKSNSDVGCKNCARWIEYYGIDGWGYCNKFKQSTSESFFCGYGEK